MTEQYPRFEVLLALSENSADWSLVSWWHDLVKALEDACRLSKAQPAVEFRVHTAKSSNRWSLECCFYNGEISWGQQRIKCYLE